MSAQVPDPAHYAVVVDAIRAGTLIPFFGAAVNLADVRQKEQWTPDKEYLPLGAHLSEHLAAEFKYPGDDPKNLCRVSQYIAVHAGETALDRKLHGIFHTDYKPTSLHRFFASLPGQMRETDCARPHLLVITTNYDDLMENAFDDADEPYDVVAYICDGKHQGRFLHYNKEMPEPEVIRSPNKYVEVTTETRSVVLKIHGAVDRNATPQYNFVVTEDDYIDFLTQGDVAKKIPALLRNDLDDGQFLFLGYSVLDWNMRAFFNSVQIKQRLANKDLRSWAIQLGPDDMETKFWSKRDVNILDRHLGDYVAELRESINATLS